MVFIGILINDPNLDEIQSDKSPISIDIPVTIGNMSGITVNDLSAQAGFCSQPSLLMAASQKEKVQ